MSSPLDVLSKEARSELSRAPMPDWCEPMLAKLTDRRFSDPAWIFERKLDGERCLAFRDSAGVRLLSRNRESEDASYPEIRDALQKTGPDACVRDGEVVAFEGSETSFERLQSRMHVGEPDRARATGVAVYYYLFDIPYLDGFDLTRVPLRERKKLLRAALAFEDPLRFTEHRNEEGEAYFEEACRSGWEGLIAKRAASPYVHERSGDWLKFKCVNEQELVVGGFTDPRGSRSGFGALLLGFYRDGELVYAGKVGTGFDEQTLSELHERLQGLERKTSPFDAGDPPSSGMHWVRPETVVQVGFTEWTKKNRLRHPRYLGLRRDKDPTDVVKEAP